MLICDWQIIGIVRQFKRLRYNFRGLRSMKGTFFIRFESTIAIILD